MAIIKHNNQSISNVTAFPSAVPSGKPTLISTATASSDSSIEFTSGIDSSYDVYKFEWVNCHPSTNDTDFTVNFRDGGSSYDATKTTTYFRASQGESGSPASLQYETAVDLAQSTGYQKLSKSGIGNDNDQSASGFLYLFSPSSTTFVKHFIARSHYSGHDEQSSDDYIAGYCNVTAAIDGIKFAFASGNIDAGTIKMYGISA